MKKKLGIGIIILFCVIALFFFRKTMVTGPSPKMESGAHVISAGITATVEPDTTGSFQEESSEIDNTTDDAAQSTISLSETAEDIPFQTDAQILTTQTELDKVCPSADSGEFTPDGGDKPSSIPAVFSQEAENDDIPQDPITIHHEAEYITIHHEEILEQIKVVDKDAYDELALIHSAYDESVVTKEAYDEQVEIRENVRKQRCRCSQIFDTVDQVNAHIASYFDTEDEAAHSSSGGITVEEVTGYEIIHHDAETTTIHHDAEYTTIHHEEEYHYETRKTHIEDIAFTGGFNCYFV